ncbi:MAG TPA: hypothetical protein EYP17_03800 [Candidatus Latescibacteria bacterium]|nr:hypothetical protein [Candidatus Latescibacterota bacterium]
MGVLRPQARGTPFQYGGLDRVGDFWRKLRRAFSVEEERLSEEELALVERAARAVVKRGLATPALLFLESVRPLNFIGSQAMRFLEPAVRSVFSAEDYGRFTRVLERREGLDALIGHIEKLSEG